VSLEAKGLGFNNMKYKLINAWNVETLNDQVNAHLADGWKLRGPTHTISHLYQEMIKYDDTDQVEFTTTPQEPV